MSREFTYFLRRRLSNKRIIVVDMKKFCGVEMRNALNAVTNVAVDFLTIMKNVALILKCLMLKMRFR